MEDKRKTVMLENLDEQDAMLLFVGLINIEVLFCNKLPQNMSTSPEVLSSMYDDRGRIHDLKEKLFREFVWAP